MKVRCPVCKFINQVGKNTAALQCSKCSSALSLYKYQANKRSRPETKTKDSPNDRIPNDADATTISGRTVVANFCRVACQSLSTFTSRVIASSISAILNRVSDFSFMILLKLLVVITIGFYSVIGYQYFFTDKKLDTENQPISLERKLYDAKLNKKVRMGGCPKLDCLLVDGHDDSHWLADDQRRWENIMDKVEIGILQFPPRVRSKVWPHAMPLYSNEFVKFAKELERKANPNWAIDELPLEDINSVLNKFLLKKKLDNK